MNNIKKEDNLKIKKKIINNTIQMMNQTNTPFPPPKKFAAVLCAVKKKSKSVKVKSVKNQNRVTTQQKP